MTVDAAVPPADVVLCTLRLHAAGDWEWLNWSAPVRDLVGTELTTERDDGTLALDAADAALTAAAVELRDGRAATARLRAQEPGGRSRWLELRLRPQAREGDGSLVATGVMLDATAQHEREDELSAAARAADLVADTAGFILYTNEYLADRTHRAVYRSRDFSHLLGGLAPGEDTETAWDAAIHRDDRAALLQFRADVFAGTPGAVEFRLRQRDGWWRWVLARVQPRTDEDGRRLGDGVLLDITARKAAELALGDALAEVDRRSRIDALTGLFNRAHCAETLQAELDRAHRSGHAVGVVVLDIDHFKTVNDEYGHAVGDAVLRAVATRIAGVVRTYDCAARWGGEEFCVVLPGVGRQDELRTIGEGLRAAIADRPVETVSGPVAVTVSVGVAATTDGLDEDDALIDAADQALYAAKRRGRDQVRLFGALSARDREEALPRSVRLAEVLALTASVREGMPLLHCRQVAELAAAVAMALGLPRRAVVRCQVAGWLHDIGKVAVPDAIVRKPGPLDADEHETMRAHSVIGDQLVRQVTELADAAPAVRHHHERWDGGGYPDGLAGEAIPVEARILAAVDAYSAMTIERVYRRPREQAEAIEELRRSAGTHLDPAVVRALVAVLEQRGDARSAAA